MDAAWINRLEPQLDAYLDEFADCFGRSDTREHLPVYVRGQLSDLPRKSVEPIALAAEVPPRTLQQFLSLLDWDHDRLRQRLHGIVSRDHADRHAVGLIDETGCPKKGTKTPGVRRQYCGATGKIDNCVTTVHLGYAADDFHCLLDSAVPAPGVGRRPAAVPGGRHSGRGRLPAEVANRLGPARPGGRSRRAFRLADVRRGLRRQAGFLRRLQRRRYRYMAGVADDLHRLAAAAAVARGAAVAAEFGPAASPTCCGIVRGCGTRRGSDSGSRTGRRGRWCGKRSG